jgi:transcriptional regulator with XRE-family HTH domain
MNADEYGALRKRLGRQKEIAARLGISRSTLAHRECGTNPITIEASLALQGFALGLSDSGPADPPPAEGHRVTERPTH